MNDRELQPVNAVPLVQGELDRPEGRKESFVSAFRIGRQPQPIGAYQR